MPTRVSFASIDVSDVFTPMYDFETPLEGRLIYLEQQGTPLLIAAFDFGGTFRSDVRLWREKVSEGTGIPPQCLWYHELQIHAAPIACELTGPGMELLIHKTLITVRRMTAEAREATVCITQTDLGTRLSINREKMIPGLGEVTIWKGMDYDEDGRGFCNDPQHMLLEDYRPDLEAFKHRIYFDGPVDPLGLLMVFKDSNGNILGSVARFAAHPDVAVGYHISYRYHYDWPGCLREKIEAVLGGTTVYLNGPCADLSTKKQLDRLNSFESAVGECQRVGGEIAEELLRSYRSSPQQFQPIRLAPSALRTILVPIREDFPRSRTEITEKPDRIAAARAAFHQAIENGLPADKVKKLIDTYHHQRLCFDIIMHWANLSEQELASKQVKVDLMKAGINGLVLMGLPGECMTETTAWLKNNTAARNLVTVDQVNGYFGYFATEESCLQGGYTYWGSWIRQDGEALLRTCAKELLES